MSAEVFCIMQVSIIGSFGTSQVNQINYREAIRVPSFCELATSNQYIYWACFVSGGAFRSILRETDECLQVFKLKIRISNFFIASCNVIVFYAIVKTRSIPDINHSPFFAFSVRQE